MLFQAVERNKGQQDGDGLYILLILGIIAVVLVLVDLQAAGTAEHNEDNAEAAYQHHNPLTNAGNTAESGDQHTGPEDHFIRAVGAADSSTTPGTMITAPT